MAKKKKIGEIIGEPIDVKSMVEQQQEISEVQPAKTPSKALTFAKGMALGFGQAAKQVFTKQGIKTIGKEIGKVFVAPGAAVSIFPEAQIRSLRALKKASESLIKKQGLEKAVEAGAQEFGRGPWIAEKFFKAGAAKPGVSQYETLTPAERRQIVGQAMLAPLMFYGGGETIKGAQAAVGVTRLAKIAQAAKTGAKVGGKFGFPVGVEQTFEEGDIRKLPQNIVFNVMGGLALGGVTGGITAGLKRAPRLAGTPKEIQSALKYIESKGTKLRERIYLRDERGKYAGSRPMPKIAEDDINTLMDFQDLVRGSYKPDRIESMNLRTDTQRLAKQYGINLGTTDRSAMTAIDNFINKNRQDIVPMEKFRLKEDFKKASGIEINDQQEKQIMDLNKKIFKDTDIKITGQILTPKGQTALGSYRNGMIKILGGQADAKNTFYHEAVHKYLDIFTSTSEQAELLIQAAKRSKNKDFAIVEEKLAEDFINYVSGQQKKTPFRNTFDKIISRIKSYFGNEDSIKNLYDDILGGKAIEKKAEGKLPFAASLQFPEWSLREAGIPIKAAEIIKVPPSQLPVGEGQIKQSRLAQRITNRLENLDQQTKDSLPVYNVMNKQDQISKAAVYVESNPSEAMAVLRGDTAPPAGLLRNSIALALEEKAIQDGDSELARNLASLYSTRLGQEISILTERDPHSPVRYIAEVEKTRIEARGGQEAVNKNIRKEITKIQSEITTTAPKKQEWSNFIDSLRC